MLEALKRRWQGSLTLRIMTFAGVITGLIIGSIYITVTSIIGADLFENRRDQVLADAARATQAAQRLLDASDASDRASLTNLMVSVRSTIRDTSSSSQLLVRREARQVVLPDAPPDFTTDAALASAITPQLEEAVTANAEPQYWQSVSFVDTNAVTQPGIIVGSVLVFPGGAGTYELFIGYSLSEAEATLAFLQQTLIMTAVLIMLVMGVLIWTVVRTVIRPIRVAAETSHRLAEGDQDERMPDLGDRRFNVLAASFNEMADTLQHRIVELDELSTMQQRFVSDVSHELRTPLTTIRLAGDVLYKKRDEFDTTTARTAELLHDQVLRFERLLEDLLEVSRYDAGSVEPTLEPTDLNLLVRESVSSLEPISDSPIEVRCTDAQTIIPVDARRIRRIVGNLLGNAVEHGEGKPITVEVSGPAASGPARSQPASNDEVRITIRDRGIGMTPEQVARVFDRFWRADPSRARTIGGTGLGLAIALEDAQLHRGTIEVHSTPGEGTEFVVVLPVHPEDAEQSGPGVVS